MEKICGTCAWGTLGKFSQVRCSKVRRDFYEDEHCDYWQDKFQEKSENSLQNTKVDKPPKIYKMYNGPDAFKIYKDPGSDDWDKAWGLVKNTDKNTNKTKIYSVCDESFKIYKDKDVDKPWFLQKNYDDDKLSNGINDNYHKLEYDESFEINKDCDNQTYCSNNNKEDIGYVYILTNRAMPDYIKIGKSQKIPELRAHELSTSTGVPIPFQVYFTVLVSNHSILEREMHHKFNHVREHTGREFFRMSPGEAKVALIELSKNRI